MLFNRQYQSRGAFAPAAAAGPNFTFVASGTGLTTTITIPGTPTAGDLAVIWNAAGGTVTPASVTPSGFENLHTLAGLNTRHNIWAKKLVGGETTVSGMDGDSRERWACATFHPDIAFTSFAAGGPVGSIVSTDPAAVSIAASGAPSLPVLLLGHMYANGSTIDPRTVSPAMTELTVNTDHYAHYKIYNPGNTPLDHSYDMDDEGGANGICAVYLTVTV